MEQAFVKEMEVVQQGMVQAKRAFPSHYTTIP